MSLSIEKRSLLKETDVDQSQVSDKEPCDNGVTLAYCCERKQSIPGQLTGPTMVNTESLSVGHPVTAAEDEIRAVSLFLDNSR